MRRDVGRIYAAVRAAVARRPALWASIIASGAGAAIVIWFAMRGLSVGIRIPIILVAAALNILIGAGYAADFESDESEHA